jgi:hypothetical protein
MLGAEILPEEVLNAIMAIPGNKSPSMDRLPYECYKKSPNETAQARAPQGNLVSDREKQP